MEVENEIIAKKIFQNIPYQVLGKTQKEKNIDIKKMFNVKLDELTKAWKEPMQKYFP